MTDDPDIADLLATLHDHLTATAERPIDHRTNRWLGEAEAVATDLVDRPADTETVHGRVGHVRELLSNVDGTGDDEADEHVARARSLADTICERTGGE